MKKFKILVNCVMIACLLVALQACKQRNGNGIIGGWEAEASIINTVDNANTDEVDNRICLYFNENLTGKEIQIINGESKERFFSYTIVDNVIYIKHESGDVWEFPYTLDQDILVLTQHKKDVKYTRIE